MNDSFRLSASTYARWTSRADGDFAGDGAGTDAQRRAIADRSWTWLKQNHGSSVVIVDEADTQRLSDGDALISSQADVALAVRTADCGSIAIAGDDWFGAIHAGWMGLVTGVVEATVAEMRMRDKGSLQAALGPCIHPASYAFSPIDLDRLAARFGESVRSTTAAGEPSFDLPEAIRISLERIGVPLVYEAAVCTAENDTDYFSHRARQEKERQALVVWKS